MANTSNKSLRQSHRYIVVLGFIATALLMFVGHAPLMALSLAALGLIILTVSRKLV